MPRPMGVLGARGSNLGRMVLRGTASGAGATNMSAIGVLGTPGSVLGELCLGGGAFVAENVVLASASNFFALSSSSSCVADKVASASNEFALSCEAFQGAVIASASNGFSLSATPTCVADYAVSAVNSFQLTAAASGARNIVLSASNGFS